MQCSLFFSDDDDDADEDDDDCDHHRSSSSSPLLFYLLLFSFAIELVESIKHYLPIVLMGRMNKEKNHYFVSKRGRRVCSKRSRVKQGRVGQGLDSVGMRQANRC
jgi:hypothetical protein